jgi:hypothetical protein
MKRIGIISLLLFNLLMLNSCEERGGSSPLYLHIQSDFNGELVKIDLDGSTVFEDSVTTMQVLGLAAIDSLEMNNGSHEIQVTVNSIYTYSENFNLSNPLWLGINYSNPGNVISILYSNEAFYYD